jgi:uncharacterized protein (DUF2267 family)
MSEMKSVEIAEAAHEAQNWLGELMAELDCDEHKAYVLLRAVLHGLRDQLSIDEVGVLAAYLPTFIRGMFLEDWRPGAATEPRSARGALGIALSADIVDALEVEVAISAAASLLDRHIAEARRPA